MRYPWFNGRLLLCSSQYSSLQDYDIGICNAFPYSTIDTSYTVVSHSITYRSIFEHTQHRYVNTRNIRPTVVVDRGAIDKLLWLFSLPHSLPHSNMVILHQCIYPHEPILQMVWALQLWPPCPQNSKQKSIESQKQNKTSKHPPNHPRFRRRTARCTACQLLPIPTLQYFSVTKNDKPSVENTC